jgi:hypothetical protein
MRPRVRILENIKAKTAATAIKTAVHTAWVETALRPIEIPNIAEPETKIQSKSH